MYTRFAGAYQRDDTGEVDAVEVVVKGRHEEIDMGDQEPGEDTEHKVVTNCTYYKLTVNGVVEIEIDILGFKETIGGVDRLENSVVLSVYKFPSLLKSSTAEGFYLTFRIFPHESN